MTIKILNKNLQTLGNYSSARTYEIDEAPVLINNKNETLDSMSVIISNLTEPVDIEPYDLVEISEITDRYFCVDTATETLTCVNPKIYRYEISLFSETKQLENTILPNLKITAYYGGLSRRNVYEYIKQYMDEYCPKIRTANPPQDIENMSPLYETTEADSSNYYLIDATINYNYVEA